jgi:hypothetical protein
MVALLLAACSDSSSSSDSTLYFSENVKAFVTIENGKMKDSVIYLENTSSGVGDSLDQFSYYDKMGADDSLQELCYSGDTRSMAIHVSLRFQPSADGKRIILGCGVNKSSNTIYFDDGDFPLTKKGYKLDLMDSLEIGEKVYRNVLVFDATKADSNSCDMARFYYAAEDGIIKVESKNGAVMTRAPKSSGEGKTEDLSSSSEESDAESSSSEASEEKSSSGEAETAESSSGEAPEQSSSSESKEESSSSEAVESSSSEPEPKKMANIEVLSYQYVFTDMDFLDLTVVNNEDHDLDSLRLMLVFSAKPEEVDVQPTQNSMIESCPILVDHDICFAYDSAGFSKSCDTDREVRDLLRHTLPVRLDDSYDSTDGTYKYLFAIPLASTKVVAHGRLRLDLGFTSGLSNDGGKSCETMRQPAKKRFSKESGDWSWMPHTKAEDGADYAGMPLEDKDYGDQGKIPVNPYIAVYRNNDYLWGYAPF